MEEVTIWTRIATITLLITELGIVLFRSRLFAKKQEVLLFAAILAILCLKLIFIKADVFQYISTFLLVIMLNQLLFFTLKSKRQFLFNVSSLAGMAAVISLIPTGFYGKPVFEYFYLLLCGCFAIISMCHFFRFIRRIKKKSLVAVFIVICLILLFGATERIVLLQRVYVDEISGVLFLVLALALAVLIFEEGYFRHIGFHGLYHRLHQEEQRARDAFSRLSETESQLIARDRFVSMGVLAAGLTHEFKNMLGLVKSLADFGIATGDLQRKEACLYQIKENTETNMMSVIGILENIKNSRLEKEQKINMEEFLLKFMKLVRANYRRAEIDISLQIESDFSVHAKRNDMEQVLLNIIRNAADALRKRNPEEKQIRIAVCREDNSGCIEICDTAGGIPEDTAFVLFDQHKSGAESTGIGLYLAKLLAEQNNALITYENRHNESRFVIHFSEVF